MNKKQLKERVYVFGFLTLFMGMMGLQYLILYRLDERYLSMAFVLIMLVGQIICFWKLATNILHLTALRKGGRRK